MTQINLLPWREQAREEQKQDFLVMLGFTALVTLGLMIFVHLIYQRLTTLQINRNQVLTNEITLLDGQIREIAALKKMKDEMIARTDIIFGLKKESVRVVHVFADIVAVLPKGVFLTSITREKNKIALEGFAESNSNVSEMMRNIERSKWLHDPVLNEVESEEDAPVNENRFILQSSLDEDHHDKVQ